MFFGDVASAATLSRAVADGRIRRLARGVFTADGRADPAAIVARNRWLIVARVVPDALIADRSAALGGRSDLYVSVLVHAWRWTAAMPWADRAALDGYLAATYALVDPTDAERSGVRLELP